MEEFLKIDWTTNIEDIVDDKFVDEDRLEREGAMYQIVNGTFGDPFYEIRPYKSIKEELDKPKKPEVSENKKSIGKKKKGRPKKNNGSGKKGKK